MNNMLKDLFNCNTSEDIQHLHVRTYVTILVQIRKYVLLTYGMQ